jgi:hypothetical protein
MHTFLVMMHPLFHSKRKLSALVTFCEHLMSKSVLNRSVHTLWAKSALKSESVHQNKLSETNLFWCTSCRQWTFNKKTEHTSNEHTVHTVHTTSTLCTPCIGWNLFLHFLRPSAGADRMARTARGCSGASPSRLQLTQRFEQSWRNEISRSPHRKAAGVGQDHRASPVNSRPRACARKYNTFWK